MPNGAPEVPDFFTRHRDLPEQAVTVTESREHWTPYPQSPSRTVYGEDAARLGEATFREQMGRPFDLPGHPAQGRVAPEEHSPYGFPPGISYPRPAPEAALDAGVHLSENLTGQVFVNQYAAFSDFPGSAAKPAAGATLSDAAFVTGRFAVLQSRGPVAVPAEESA